MAVTTAVFQTRGNGGLEVVDHSGGKRLEVCPYSGW